MSRKNMFTINIDSDSVIDFDELVLRKESREMAQKRKALDDRLSLAMHQSIRKRLVLDIIPFIAVMIAVACIVASIYEYLNSHSLPIIPSVLALAFLFVASVSFVMSLKRNKKNEMDGGIKLVDDEYGVYNELVKKELGVPEDAKAVEIFTNMYSQNDAKLGEVYTNDTANVFEEDGKLCFHYGSAVLGFPMLEIEGVVKIDDTVTFDSWGKDIPYDRGNYMQYKIKKNKVDGYVENYSMTGYYSLRFTHFDTPFEIVIPLYDIDSILEILKTEPITE